MNSQQKIGSYQQIVLARTLNHRIQQIFVEDVPGHYVSAQYAQYGVYDYDTGELLPEGYKVVVRYYRGNILVVFKWGPYNGIPSTYDGRHSMVGYQAFSEYIETLVNAYNKLVERGCDPELIQNLPKFGQNPFEHKHKKEIADVLPIPSKRTKEYIEENYANWDFSRFLNYTTQQGSAVFYIEFVFEKKDILMEFVGLIDFI